MSCVFGALNILTPVKYLCKKKFFVKKKCINSSCQSPIFLLHFPFITVDFMLSIFLDLETTGLDPTKHHVIEIAFKIIDVPTDEEKYRYHTVVKQSPEVWEKRDPHSVEINGFSWDDLIKGKEIEEIRKEIIQIFTNLGVQRGKAVYICQNPAFDRGFFGQIISVYTQQEMNWPYHWLDLASMYWALLVQENQQKGMPFPTELNLSKNTIALRYGIPPEVDPHRAMNGVEHLYLCYQTVVQHKKI